MCTPSPQLSPAPTFQPLQLIGVLFSASAFSLSVLGDKGHWFPCTLGVLPRAPRCARLQQAWLRGTRSLLLGHGPLGPWPAVCSCASALVGSLSLSATAFQREGGFGLGLTTDPGERGGDGGGQASQSRSRARLWSRQWGTGQGRSTESRGVSAFPLSPLLPGTVAGVSLVLATS